VVIKQHRAEADLARSPATRARHEFEVLTRLRELMPEAYTVPRPIQLDEANGSVVMERAAGTPLDVLMREHKRGKDALDRLVDPMRRAGQWLRAMQHATSDSRGRRPAGRTSAASAEEILATQVSLAIHNATPRVAARLHELEQRVLPHANITCGHHGDYWPGNIFLDEERVTVIDFEGYREGFPLEDVAYFLIELELLLPRHARYVPALRVAFLDGYGGIDDAGALHLFTLTKALHLLARDPGAGHPLLVALWIRYTLHSIVRRCLPR